MGLLEEQHAVTQLHRAGRSEQQSNGEVVEIPAEVVGFVEAAPWTPIQSLKARLEGRDPCAPTDPIPCEHQRELFGPGDIADPHWYIIRNWSRVDDEGFRFLAKVIRSLGYRAEYRAPYWRKFYVNRYLDLEGYVYWWVYPNQLCRTKAGWNSRRPLPAQGCLLDGV